MDKESVKQALLNPDNIDIDIIKDYCIEHKKDVHKTMLFIQIIMMTSLTRRCYDIALEYYQKKYNLCLVYNRQGQLTNIIDNVIKRQTNLSNQETV